MNNRTIKSVILMIIMLLGASCNINGDGCKKEAMVVLKPVAQVQDKASEKIGVEEQIDNALAVILSSPKEFSNISDYINAHPKEYQQITALGDSALPHLMSIWDNGDRGLAGVLAISLCRKIHPLLNFNSAISPNHRLRIETFGIETNITAAGLFPAKGIRLVDATRGNIFWEMHPGYYSTEFHWTADSHYVSVYFAGRISGTSIILSSTGKEQLPIPGIDRIKKIAHILTNENQARSDPDFKVMKWIENHNAIFVFHWREEGDWLYEGTFEYDVSNNRIGKLRISKKLEG